MNYYEIYIESKIKGLNMPFTYCSDLDIEIGSLVFVPFSRHRSEIRGVVVKKISDEVAFSKNKMEVLQEDENLESSKSKEAKNLSQKDDLLNKDNKLISPDSMKSKHLPDKEAKLKPNKKIKIKEIIRVIDFCIPKGNIETAKWMSERYFINVFDCLKLFLPSVSKSKSKKSEKVDDENCVETNFRNGNKNDKESAKKNFSEIDLKKITENFSDFKLTKEQQNVSDEINKTIKENKYKTFLLKGVTGSGKTENYISACFEAIKNKKSVIVLVPEITLTAQTIERFSKKFGRENISIIHSNISKGKKEKEWEVIRKSNCRIVIGARSALFSPVNNLGLIIIDEEHESSYKSDMTPKYNAIEVAAKMSSLNNSVLILGSATPSVVSYYRAKRGYYKLLTLKKRYSDIPMPKINIVDMRKELTEGNSSVYSGELEEEILKAKENGKQTLLLLNRRGYAPYVQCLTCGESIRCPNCNLPLTYHKSSKMLSCHFCGKNFNVPKTCPNCKSETLKIIGIGTEKLEEITKKIFEGLEVSRVDFDTIRKKGEIEKLLSDYKNGKTDILIGTQIIAKGLDFDNVLVSGIILVDIGLNLPDYRSHERIFSLITQVAGRAGRRNERGKVFIQTYEPDNNIIKAAALGKFEYFYDEEIRVREIMNLPPFSDLIQLTFQGTNENELVDFTLKITDEIRGLIDEDDEANLLGPSKATVYTIDKKFRYHLYLKVTNKKRKKYFSLIKKIVDKDYKNFYVSVDVNPYSFL